MRSLWERCTSLVATCVIVLVCLAQFGPAFAKDGQTFDPSQKAGSERQRTVYGETLPTPLPIGRSDIYRSQVLLGTALGIFWHEFGHALIGETGLPATGPEEDVADGFSAFVLSAALEESTTDPQEQSFMAEVVRYSSLLWYYVAAHREETGNELVWQDEHAPDLRRFRNSFCIIYGSNPERHEALAREVGLSDRSRERCRQVHQKRYRAWETILRTVSRDLGTGFDGAYPIDEPGGRILLNFEPSSTETGQTLINLLNGTGMMVHMMAEMERTFVWPRDLTIEFRDCAIPNAWYSPDDATVTMCYGLIERLSKLIFRAEGRAWK